MSSAASQLERGGSRLGAAHALLSQAGILGLGTLATAALGFVYWVVAARHFAPDAVGSAAAAISLMVLLAHVGEFGLGPYLIGAIAGFGASRGALIAASVCIAAALSFATAALGLAVLAFMHSEISGFFALPLVSLLFVVGVVGTGIALVIDQAFVGMLRPGLQMIRNVVFAAGKLAVLMLFAIYGSGADGGVLILGSWVAGLAMSALALIVVRRLRLESVWHRPRLYLLRAELKAVWAHHLLNVVLQAPALALPMVVAIVVSTETNAAFYTAWTLINVALLIPASLSTALFSTSAHQPGALKARLRVSLLLSAVAGLAVGLLFLVASQTLLGAFNPRYAEITGNALGLIGFGVLGIGLKYHFVAIMRLRGRMMSAARFFFLGSAAELAAAAIGGHVGGLSGLVAGWLALVFLQVACAAPTLWRAATSADEEPRR